jgi:hypothetical protein
VPLSDGAASTSVLEQSAQGTDGGLAADGTGHLWITYGRQVIRVDEPGGTIRTWALPMDDDPTAGNAEAAVWDATASALLFVRDHAHRLYRFDAASGEVSIAADLPITTSSHSRLTIGSDEAIAVTGSRIGSPEFAPAAVRLSLPTGSAGVADNVLAVCTSPFGLAELDRVGRITLPGSSATSLSPVSKLPSNVPFACDPTGNVFATTDAKGSVTIDRLSSAGVLSSTQLPLIPGVVEGIGGVRENSWADPRLVALMPDGSGGVWLVSEAGTQTIEELPSSYPSLEHVAFSP